MARQTKQTYPAGWDEERVRKLAEHYDSQTEDEQSAEHETAFRAEGQTVIIVPTELVAAIVKLIDEKRSERTATLLGRSEAGNAR